MSRRTAAIIAVHIRHRADVGARVWTAYYRRRVSGIHARDTLYAVSDPGQIGHSRARSMPLASDDGRGRNTLSNDQTTKDALFRDGVRRR
jgi:hypothetical protein